MFAPDVAHAAIRELAGIAVRWSGMRLTNLTVQQPLVARDDKTRPIGSFVATGSRDKSIKIWDAASGLCLHTLVRLLRLVRPILVLTLSRLDVSVLARFSAN